MTDAIDNLIDRAQRLYLLRTQRDLQQITIRMHEIVVLQLRHQLTEIEAALEHLTTKEMTP